MDVGEGGRKKEGEKKNVEIMNTIKEAVRKGNVSKIVIKKGEETIMNLPVNIGIIGTVLFPWAAIGGCIAALGTKCTIELVNEAGEVVNVSEKAAKTFETVKDKGSVIYDEVKDKSGDLYEAAKDKFTKEKEPETEESFAKPNDFDLSDLDLDEMEEDK